MANIAAAYGEVTTVKKGFLNEYVENVENEEKQRHSHQHQVLHKNWLEAGYTSHFLSILQKEIASLNRDLETMALSPLEPARYYLLKDKLQRKHLLEQVLKCAQEGTDKLQPQQ